LTRGKIYLQPPFSIFSFASWFGVGFLGGMEQYYDECAAFYDNADDNDHGKDGAQEPPSGDVSGVTRTYVCVERVAKAITAHFADTAAANTVTRVLDVGVGTGLATHALVQHLSLPTDTREFHGVDLSRGMLDVCRGKGLVTYLHQCDLNKQDLAEVLRQPTGGNAPLFDIILSTGTTEFVHDHSRLFGQVAALLVPGRGVFCSTFAANGVATYPDLTVHTSEASLRQLAYAHHLDVHSIERYHGWSATATEHVDYFQLLASRRCPS
jgi:trans-aconitate methyltransferase